MKRFFALIGILVLLFSGCAGRPGLSVAIGQHPRSTTVRFTDSAGSSRAVEVRYFLYLPEGYGRDAGVRWPFLMFLHGYGERGHDLSLLLRQPLPQTLENRTDFPFIVVSPQLPDDEIYWTGLIDPLNTLIDGIASEFSVDPNRLYLTGLSMGGYGTWEFAMRYPHRFAAIVPIAGGWRYRSAEVPEGLRGIKDLPIWVFHGAVDTTVLPDQSQRLVDALRSYGSAVRFTLYPDADHVATWVRAYADPALWEWLASQRLPDSEMR